MNATLLTLLNFWHKGWHYRLLDVYDAEIRDIIFSLAEQLGLDPDSAYKQAFVYVIMKQARYCLANHMTVT